MKQYIKKIQINYEIKKIFYLESYKLISESIKILGNLNEENLQVFKRNLHTMKGNFAVSKHQRLELLVHSLEDFIGALEELKLREQVFSTAKIESIAERIIKQSSMTLNRLINFEFKSEETIEIDKPVLETINMSLLHILKNAIDHGIESEETRVSKNKPKFGKIIVEVKKINQEQFQIEIIDDGQGLNKSAIREKMGSRGIHSNAGCDSIERDQKICDLIFLDGFTTKNEVSLTSGRGYGLSAVKQKICEIGGDITVNSKDNIGTTFKMLLPRHI